jgi:hypothetical protein
LFVDTGFGVLCIIVGVGLLIGAGMRWRTALTRRDDAAHHKDYADREADERIERAVAI